MPQHIWSICARVSQALLISFLVLVSRTSADDNTGVAKSKTYRFAQSTLIRRCTSTGYDWPKAPGTVTDALAGIGWKFIIVDDEVPAREVNGTKVPARIVIRFLDWAAGTMFRNFNVDSSVSPPARKL